MSLPPGPRSPAPVQMWQWIARPIPFLTSVSHRYGDFFTLRFVVGPIVFVADPQVIKQVFRGDPDVFHAGEANATPLEPLMGRNSVLLLDGPEHMRQRKLMLPSFHGERMQRYGALMQEIAEREIERWPVGQPFGLRPRTQAITLEIIMRTVFGIDDAERLARLSERLGAMLDIGMQSRALAAIAIPPVRKTIGRRLWNRFLRLRAAADAEIYDEIARRRQATDIEQRDDVLSILLQAHDEDGRPMTDQELRDELMTLLVAGHETTATTLAWAFDLLLRHPAELERLAAEMEAGEEHRLPRRGDQGDAAHPSRGARRGARADRADRAERLRAARPVRAWRRTSTSRTAGPTCTRSRSDSVPSASSATAGPTRTRGSRSAAAFAAASAPSFALYELKIVIPAILRGVQLRAAGAEPERIRRRAITFVPEHDAQVVVEAVREPRALAAAPV